MNVRYFHRTAAVVLLLPLTLTATTGLTYRVGRYWFGMSEETGRFIRGLHEGMFLGEAAVPGYVLLTGLGLLGMIASGLVLLRGGTSLLVLGHPSRRLHRWVAAIWSLPLAVSAATGIGYRLSQSWLGWSKSEAKFLLDLHQGTSLGPTGRAWYVIVIGSGLLLLLVTGFRLLGWRVKPGNQ